MRLLLAGWTIGLLLPGWGQSQCSGPPEIERAIKNSPSADAYDALGAWFAQQHQLPCAIAAFESGLKLNPNSWETHFNLGLALIEGKQPERAVAQFREAVKLKPDAVQARNALGVAFQASGRLEQAEQEFKESVKFDARSADSLDHLAQVYSAQRRYGLAIETWNRAIALAPADPGLKVELAVAHANNGDATGAIAILTKLVEAVPDLASAHFNLATVYAGEKRFREAADEYAATLKLEPANDPARLALVKADASIANFESARPIAEQYVKHLPADYEGHYLLGSIYKGLALYPEAERELKRAAAGNPDVYGLQYDLGFVLAHEGRPQEAMPRLRKALELQPQSAEAKFQLANVLKALSRTSEANAELGEFRQEKQRSVEENMAAAAGNDANQLLAKGDSKGAAERYRDALKLDPNNAKTWFNLSLALDDLHEFAQERNALEKAIALDASLKMAHNQLGLLDAADGKTADAEKHFLKAMELDPQFAAAQSNLGVLYGRLGRAREAEDLLRKATENDPRLTEAFVNLGLILAGEGRLADAKDELRKAVELSPNNVTALTGLGMAAQKSGKSEEAIELFRRVAKLQPNSAEAHLNLGIALADSYRPEEALAEFSTAEQLAPNAASPHYNRGRVLTDLRRYEEALPELKEACRRAPKYPAPFYLLALANSKLGKREEAVNTLQKLLALQPGNADAYLLLGQNLQKLGKTAEAIAAWKKASDSDPDQLQALYSLWRATAKTDPLQGKLLEQRFIDLQKKKQLTSQVETLANFAIASANRGDYQEATSQLRDAVAQCGDCQLKAALYKDLGLIECKSGDIRSGEKDLLRAKALKPQDTDVAQALNTVTNVKTHFSSTPE
jgi:tetratricopeptide (TPR) repeat protein